MVPTSAAPSAGGTGQGGAMAFSGGNGSDGPMSEINVTPLVDVMLVLLIIFMVTAPMMQQGVEVDLPEAEAETVNSPDQKLVLTVTKDRKVYLGSSEVPFDRISELLASNARLKEDKELFLHADQELPYGVVVQVMAAAKKGGAENLAMVTDPVTGAPAPTEEDK
jgi:biopolymer transport protein TolR